MGLEARLEAGERASLAIERLLGILRFYDNLQHLDGNAFLVSVGNVRHLEAELRQDIGNVEQQADMLEEEEIEFISEVRGQKKSPYDCKRLTISAMLRMTVLWRR